jgi:hypothetical protein
MDDCVFAAQTTIKVESQSDVDITTVSIVSIPKSTNLQKTFRDSGKVFNLPTEYEESSYGQFAEGCLL